jgi:hypothetical protein
MPREAAGVTATCTHAAPPRERAPEAAPAISTPAALAQAITAAAGKDWLTELELQGVIPVSRRTLKDWRDAGKLPYVRLPGTRRVLYHLESVHKALLRHQTGGNQ